MPFAIPSWLKIGAIALVLIVVAGGAFALRHDLIEKGKNIVYAQDNAALVKAQKEQAERDAKLVTDQKAYIDHLESRGVEVKEKIRVVQAPCTKDGADDPRLGDTVDWLRLRPADDNGKTSGGPSPQRTVPPPRLPAAKR